MIFSNKVSHQTVYPTLYLNRVRLKEVDEHKHIGLILSKNLSWRKHITEICEKANKHLDVMFRMKRLLPRVVSSAKSFMSLSILILMSLI
jgi:hypothetical protein